MLRCVKKVYNHNFEARCNAGVAVIGHPLDPEWDDGCILGTKNEAARRVRPDIADMTNSIIVVFFKNLTNQKEHDTHLNFCVMTFL